VTTWPWGVKMGGAVLLSADTVARGRKNAQIYISKRAKKMSRRKCNSQDLVLGEEQTLLRQKYKNFTLKRNLI
jgi:hypothetical protein